MKEKRKCPVCKKIHRTKKASHRCLMPRVQKGEIRGHFDEVVSFGTSNLENLSQTRSRIPARGVVHLFKESLDEEYVGFDRKGRGSSLNHDLYGYDASQGVAIIQSRQAYRTHKNGYLSTRKTYFLCGHNENGAPFRHPISSSAVRGAINAGANALGVVRAAQRWMWEVTDNQLSAGVRQGDLLLVPEHREPKGEHKGQVMTLAESHEIHATEIIEGANGRIYAKNPRIIHSKGQHAPIAVDGWASVRIGREASAWDFAERIGD